jgi:hypothetical protein
MILFTLKMEDKMNFRHLQMIDTPAVRIVRVVLPILILFYITTACSSPQIIPAPTQIPEFKAAEALETDTPPTEPPSAAAPILSEPTPTAPPAETASHPTPTLPADDAVLDFISAVYHDGRQVFLFNQDFDVIGSFDSPGYLTPVWEDCLLRRLNVGSDLITFQEILMNGMVTKSEKIDLADSITWDHYDFQVSPSGKHIAFKVVSGDFRGPRDAPIQNVMIVRNDSTTIQPVTQLTRNGGSYPEIAWAPNSRYLAYTDYDGAGIVQIYLYDETEQTIRAATGFGVEWKGHKILELAWSPDSAQLAFSGLVVKEVENGETYIRGKIGLLSVLDDSILWLNLEPLWNFIAWRIQWDPEWDQLLITLDSLDEEDHSEDRIIWFDLKDNKISRQLTGSFEVLWGLYFAIPLPNTNRVGLIANEFTYVYEPDSGLLIQKEFELPFSEIREVYPLAVGDSGFVYCTP